MRLWSIHPTYLDAKGLVAVWREALLAKHVLLGKTKGYTNHPQLIRFKTVSSPVGAIDRYLHAILVEATHRGYQFDHTKIGDLSFTETIPVTTKQVEYEFEHLKRKLLQRDLRVFESVRTLMKVETHPLFTLVEGEIENWEKV